MDSFPPEVAERLKWYVYRLIDPRNGETFCVGKGRGSRIFAHARGVLALTDDEDATDLKSQRIKEIAAVGLEVQHVVHRHNIESAEVAYQIEAALIDAYPGLSNKVGGHGSGDYGCRHVEELVAEYSAQEFEVVESLVLISIPQSYEDATRSVYDAVRAAWRIDVERARKVDLVLAHRRGIVLGVFRPETWMEAKTTNFPWLASDIPGRWGFEGRPVELEVEQRYLRKRVPDRYRARGAANPIRFVQPGAE